MLNGTGLDRREGVESSVVVVRVLNQCHVESREVSVFCELSEIGTTAVDDIALACKWLMRKRE